MDTLLSGWRDNVDEFKTTTNNRLLHIQANTDAEASLLNRCLVRYLGRSASSAYVPVFHFTFQRGDVRFDNIRSMLATLLAQLAFNKVYSAAIHVKIILLTTAEYRGWATDDLLALWRRFRLNKMDREVVYVFGSVDQCDKSKRDFLHWLNFMASRTEMPFKVIFTSTAGTDSEVEKAFLSCPADVYQRVNVSAQDGCGSIQSSECITQVAPSSELSPIHLRFGPRLAHLQAQVTGDDTWSQVTIDWLRHTRLPINDIAAVLGRLGERNLSDGLNLLLGLIPTPRKLWSRRLLSFACASVRPLRVVEVCAASHLANLLPDMPTRTDSASWEKPLYLRDHLDDILQWLGAFLKITNDELHLTHPSLHDALRSLPQWEEAQQHRDILDVCTAYLRQPPIAKTQTDSTEKPGTPEDVAGFGLFNLADALPYATEYWSRHYQLLRAAPGIPESSIAELDDRTRKFLREGPFQHPLLTSAELGLSHLVLDFLSASSQQRELSIIAAAKNGHVEVVKKLLEPPGNDEMDYTVLVEAAKVASLCETAEAFRCVVHQLSNAQHPNPLPTLPSTLVFRAAWLGLDDTVQALLELGMSAAPDGLDDNISPLHAAVVLNRVVTLKVLIRYGADINIKSASHGYTPLDYACIYGSARCAEELISRLNHLPVVSELEGHGSRTAPLGLAVEHGNFEVAEILLKRDKLQNRRVEDCREEYGDALQYAVKNNRRRGVELLLRYGADPNFELLASISPLQQAIWNGRADICALLLEGGADVEDSRFGSVPLAIATERGDAAIVSLLLRHGASVDAVDAATKRSALHVAASLGRSEIIKMLLEAGADIEAREEESCTPIWIAARNERVDAVQILAVAGADVNATSSWHSWTPLHVSYDLPAVTRVLLRYGADVDRAGDGWTPLWLATVYDQPEVMKLLLQKGASLEKSKKDGDTLFASAVRYRSGNVEVLRTLLEAGEDVNQPIGPTFAMEYAIGMASSEMVELLLEFSPNLGLPNRSGKAVLHYITKDTPVRSVQRLVNAGADPNVEDGLGHSALCAAITCSNAEVVRYLLQSRVVNRHGITHEPLFGGLVHHATQASSLEVLRLLSEAGQDMAAASPAHGGAVAAACYPIRPEGELYQMIRYLIDEAKVDVRAKGGVLGYAINVAASRCGPEVIGAILTAGALLDDMDLYERSPIHLACQNQLATLEALQVPDDQFKRRDIYGRLPLSFAAVSGSVDLARHVLERSRRVGLDIDAVDHHGWTALMWVARAPVLWPEKSKASKDDHEQVIKFLLDEKADPSVSGRVSGGGKWTPLEIATYHRASNKVLSLLSAGTNSAPLSGSTKKPIGVEQNMICDGCLMVKYVPTNS